MAENQKERKKDNTKLHQALRTEIDVCIWEKEVNAGRDWRHKCRNGESDLALSKRISGSTCVEERPFAREQQVMGRGNYCVEMSESVRRSQSSQRRNRLYRTIANNIERTSKISAKSPRKRVSRSSAQIFKYSLSHVIG